MAESLSYTTYHQRIFDEEEHRLVRVYESPNTPAVVVVPESQAERILSDENDLLKPEDAFAALLSVPEPHTLKFVVLLDERDEYARTVEHPKWPPAHKSFGEGGEVCFHGVSKRDDPAAMLNYHWAIQQIRLWNRDFRELYALATLIELGLDLSDDNLDIDWGAHMAGDILAQEPKAFDGFAAQEPLRTLALCRGLRAAVAVEGAPPLADWLAGRLDHAEATVRAAARRQLVEMVNTTGEQMARDKAVSLLLHYGEEEDIRALVGVTRLRVRRSIFTRENIELITHLTSLEEVDLSFHQDDLGAWLWSLSRCQNVKELTLTGSNVLSFDLSALPTFKTLTSLDLTRTRIIDVGVPCIIAAKGLRRLDITDTRISEEGVASLRRGLPDCEIIEGSRHAQT
ncbi:MAG TPA: hypothetical protein VH985_24225 [Candidatus Binatia bacterium]|jgi:hypothetical protein